MIELYCDRSNLNDARLGLNKASLAMRQHLKQAAFTCGLALPLIVTLLFSKPFTADSVAQAGLHMVGPQFPILVDNGDGRPGGGDTQLLPRQSGANTLELPTVFSCGTQPNNVVTLGSPDASGKFRTASRTNNGRDQAINIAGTSGGGASQFSYMETAVGSTFASGSGALMDMNGDGAMDAMSLGGTNGSGVVSLVFTPDSNYVSIPASQAALLGARQGRCGPAAGQIFVPLADTNGDGRGDTVVLDLNGDGIPDPQYYTSPRLGALGVPATNNVALAALIVLLGVVGVWYLGNRRLDGAARA